MALLLNPFSVLAIYNESERSVRRVADLWQQTSSVTRWHHGRVPLQRSEACMTFVRSTRRVAIVGASLTALLVAAACGGGGGGGAAPAASGAAVDLTKKGDFEHWQGKDTSGNLKNLVNEFNSKNPDGKVTRQGAAGQRRPAAPADDPEHPDQERQDGFDQCGRGVDRGVRGQRLRGPAADRPVPDRQDAEAHRGQRDLLQQAVRLPARPPTAACSTTARTCWTSISSSRRPRGTR